MRFLDRTFPAADENLACDEALLDICDRSPGTGGILRVWESAHPFVVLGYTSPRRDDVEVAACTADGIPVLRRCSGGGTVLQGPGCLSYAVIAPIDAETAFSSITGTNVRIMQSIANALQPHVCGTISIAGATDLTFNGRKFSGNSQRRKERALLFHGTILLSLDLQLLGRYLRMPGLAPVYRAGRPHADFVTNLPVARDRVIASLREAWGAEAEARLPDLPEGLESLMPKYRDPGWILRK